MRKKLEIYIEIKVDMSRIKSKPLGDIVYLCVFLQSCVVVVDQTSVIDHDLIKVKRMWLQVMALFSGVALLPADLSTCVLMPSSAA